MKKPLLILTTFLIAVIGYSQTVGDTFVDNFITYEVTSLAPDTVEATIYDGSGGSSVNIPSSVLHGGNTYSVTSIGDNSFTSRGLTSVTFTLPSNITNIGQLAFADNSLTTIEIPDGVINIVYAAFAINNLTSVIVPNSVTTIGDSAFEDNAITNATISNSLTSLSINIFSDNNLSTIIIPDSVTHIETGAFNYNQLTSVTIPSNVTTIESYAFQNNPLTNVYSESIIPPTISTGGATDSFNSDRSTIDLHIPSGTMAAYVTDGGALWTGFNSVTEVGGLIVGDTFIDNFITYEITSLTPDTVEAIDYDIAGGTVVDIPADLIYNSTNFDVVGIGYEAFNEKSLTSVIIPNSITSIGDRAFRNNQLTSVTIPDGVTIINNEMFINNQLTNVIMGNTVTSIEFAAFQDNNLTTIALPNSLTNIGLQSFYNNNLTSITIPDGVTSIEGNAFYNNNLSSLVLPNNLTTISGNAFRNNSLTSITFGDNVTTIGTDSFSFNNLTSITFGSNVTNIGSSAFRNNQLTTVSFPGSVDTIGWRAFINNQLVSVTSESITPPSVFSGGVSDDSFGIRSGIDLTIPNGTTNDYLSNDWTGFNSVTEAGGFIVGDTFIDNFITYEITSLTPDTVEAIYYDIAGGTIVDIPAIVPNTSFSVTSIGDNCFTSKGLTSVTFTLPSNITNIGQLAFADNSLTTIEIPDGVINIVYAAFAINNLTSVIVPNSVTTLGDSAFEDNALTSATISNSLTSLGINIFNDNALSTIIIPDNITNIGIGTFNNNQLTSVTIPANVTTIESFAFQNNPLTNVYSESIIPPTISTGGATDSFNSDRSTIHLHIPGGTMGAYVTDGTALWTGFNPVTEDALSINDFELANHVNVITTTDAIKILASNSLRLQNYTVYSITGAKIATGKQSEIATSSFSNGIYILKLDFNEGTIIKKVVVN